MYPEKKCRVPAWYMNYCYDLYQKILLITPYPYSVKGKVVNQVNVTTDRWVYLHNTFLMLLTHIIVLYIRVRLGIWFNPRYPEFHDKGYPIDMSDVSGLTIGVMAFDTKRYRCYAFTGYTRPLPNYYVKFKRK